MYSVSQLQSSHVYLSSNRPSKSRSNWRLYTRTQELTAFMLSTYAKLLQWRRYFGLCSTQVPHTYSVSQLLPSHAYLTSNRHRESRSNWRLYTRAWDSSGFMLSTCDKLLQWCWYFGLCSTQVPHTYLLSQLQSSHVYLSRSRHRQNAQLTFVHSWSRFDCFYAVNLCRTAAMMEVFWSMLYTGTPHIFGLPTAVITCVFVKQ